MVLADYAPCVAQAQVRLVHLDCPGARFINRRKANLQPRTLATRRCKNASAPGLVCFLAERKVASPCVRGGGLNSGRRADELPGYAAPYCGYAAPKAADGRGRSFQPSTHQRRYPSGSCELPRPTSFAATRCWCRPARCMVTRVAREKWGACFVPPQYARPALIAPPPALSPAGRHSLPHDSVTTRSSLPRARLRPPSPLAPPTPRPL
jgi:hypothetical protein